jgi:hypothetical protein
VRALIAILLAGTTATQVVSGDVVVDVRGQADGGVESNIPLRCVDLPLGDGGSVLRYCRPEGV